MYVKVSGGFRHSCKNRGASDLRGFCPTGLFPTTDCIYEKYVFGYNMMKKKTTTNYKSKHYGPVARSPNGYPDHWFPGLRRQPFKTKIR